MCGIAGFLDRSGSTTAGQLAAIATAMASCLEHRGPDDEGVWTDPPAGLAISHRRLSVIDLSSEGHQPMESADRRWVVAFNGEIYNFVPIRKRLEGRGHRFRGHSDTEVLLAAVSEWGVEDAVAACNGMFALALWDRRERRLWLVRDRLGEKPLYYGRVGDVFLFGSELKALRRHPSFSPTIDRDALASFLRYGYVPAPQCIYTGIRKLAPGWLLHLDADGHGLLPRERAYWSAKETAEGAVRHRAEGRDVVEELEPLLRDAVALRMTADVPLGAFLSGGIDSSTVVALMQSQSVRPVRTFSIGFEDAAYDEAAQAREVARYLGTDHTELYVTPEDAIGVIPRLPEVYDEPFADSSQIPTLLVARMARRHVTVALSGDGGDELFLGYDRYRWIPRLWRCRRGSPPALRQALVRALEARSPEDWDRLVARLRKITPPSLAQQRIGDRLHRLSDLLQARGPLDLYFRTMTHWQDPSSVVIGAQTAPSRMTDPSERVDGFSLPEQFAYLDAISYLPDDILTKVDRASMAVGLEARIPLLDPRVVEFAWSIPAALKVYRGRSKWPLRQVLYRYVPKHLVDRPKMGFNVPVGAWLRGPLRDWAEGQLHEDRLRSGGYLSPEPVRARWRDHLNGRGATQQLLWNVLMFQSWAEHTRA